MSPRIVDKEERKGLLLAAAVAVFGDKGYHHATMQDVADCAGVSKGGLYDYFDSKEELLLCTAEWLLQTTLDAAVPILERAGTPLRDRVATFIDALLQQTESVRPMMFTILQVWAEMGTGRDSSLHALCTHLYKNMADRLQSAFESAIASGDAAPFPTRPAALAIMAIIDGLLLQSMLSPDDFAIQRESRFIPQWCAAAVGPLNGVRP